jgi:hypothetical protein
VLQELILQSTQLSFHRNSQQNMGHASLDTTTGYTVSEERRRMKAAQAAWSRRDSRPSFHDPS